MPIKTVLFLVGFLTCTAGALWVPFLGIVGYVANYSIGSERQWWSAPLNRLGIRYSLTFAAATGVGMILNYRKIRSGNALLVGQEKLMLIFLGIVWLSTVIGEPTAGRYTTVDHPSVKFTKVVMFALMMTHVVTNLKSLDRVVWVLIFTSLALGVQAYETPRHAFSRGRLEGIGGADFSEANFLAAYLVAMLPLIGVQFLRCGWLGKIVCLASGVFTTNAIVLTRSRGAVVGLAGGILVGLLLAPKRYRRVVLIAVLVAVLGGLYLADPQFVHRAETITRSEDELDRSARSRLDLWWAAGRMFREHPAGVGAGNFYQTIGRYDPQLEGRDAHNTFVRCGAELGAQGMVVFLLLVLNAARTLWRAKKRAEALPPAHRDGACLLGFGLLVSVATFLTSCLTISMVYAEAMWWFLLLPVCLTRSLDNLERDLAGSPALAASPRVPSVSAGCTGPTGQEKQSLAGTKPACSN